MSQWYYSDYARNRLGPVQASDLADLHAAGQLTPETLVWKEGWPQWKAWSAAMGEVVPAMGAPSIQTANFATASSDAPASAGNPYAMAEARSPYAPPVASLAGSEAVIAGGEVVYAGFRKRAAAYVIDGLLVGIVGFVLQMLIFGVMFGLSAAAVSDPGAMLASGAGIGMIVAVYLIPLVLNLVYFVMFHAGQRQATLGKMAIGIKVTDAYGGRISAGRATGRFFATIVSSIIIGIGFVMAAFTDRKRALHDLMCDTLVVDQWAFTAHPERQRRELGTVTTVILALLGLMVVGYAVLIVVLVAVAIGAS